MPPTLLFCLAHPDDESFSGAGTIMKYAETGMRTVLVTGTLGERGKVGDPPVCSIEELPAYRERELREAAAIIGICELHLLGYRDKELADAPPDAVRRALVTVIRRERPSIVFTFDPNGFNVHPDHVAISRFTTDAIAAAADPRWYPDAGAPHSVTRLSGRRCRRRGSPAGSTPKRRAMTSSSTSRRGASARRRRCAHTAVSTCRSTAASSTSRSSIGSSHRKRGATRGVRRYPRVQPTTSSPACDDRASYRSENVGGFCHRAPFDRRQRGLSPLRLILCRAAT